MEEIISNTPGVDDVSVTVSDSIIDTSTPISTPNKFNFTPILRWGAIILILAFLGFNIFTSLGKATDETTNFLSPIIQDITNFFGGATKTVVDASAKGVKFGTDIAAGTVKSGVDVLSGTIGSNKKIRNKIDDTTEDVSSESDER